MGAICETKLRDDDGCVLIFLIFEAEDVYEDILTALWKAQEVNEGFGLVFWKLLCSEQIAKLGLKPPKFTEMISHQNWN